MKKRDKVSAYSSLLFIIEICPLEVFLEFDSDFFRNIKGYNVLLSYNIMIYNIIMRDISQIYLNLDDFIKEQKKLTKILINEKKEK